jgi:hypothetical protein
MKIAPDIQRMMPPVPPGGFRTVTDEDLKLAVSLKDVLEVESLPEATTRPTPHPEIEGVFVSPEGNPMFYVNLFSASEVGMVDGPNHGALVDPTRNTYYLWTTGGVGGIADFMNGPAQLPEGHRFRENTFTATDARLLTQAVERS